MKNDKVIKFQNHEVTIKYKKIKNIILKINLRGNISTSVPYRISDKQIEEFLESKKDWIEKSINKFSKVASDDFYYLGKKYQIKKIFHNNRESKFLINENFFEIYHHPGFPEKTIERHLETYFENKLNELTKDFFEKWEKTLGVSKKSLTIKKLKGKWGYCHTKNHEICLNLDLIKKDIKFIEYVVLHEICHILVPNHGPDFKALLNIHMPEWRKLVKEYSI